MNPRLNSQSKETNTLTKYVPQMYSSTIASKVGEKWNEKWGQ